MLKEVRSALRINFDDPDIDAELLRLIDESTSAFDMLIGEEIDYKTDQVAKELLINRVRYAYNSVVDLFEDNYKHEILRYQLSRGYHVAETNE